MNDPSTGPFELILRQCAAAAPEPWYPKSYANATGVNRDLLDPPLERLRMAGLVRLTDWVQGHGQGYVLTPEGERTLRNPRELSRLQAGILPVRHEEPDEPVRPQTGMTPYERGEAIREALLNPVPARVTLLLILANVGVFLAGAALAQQANVLNDYLSGNRDGLPIIVQLGALRSVDVNAGQWWRLITCSFVHIGFLHLLMNMIGLYMIGPAVERMFGGWRFLLLYLISGLGGSVAMAVSLIAVPLAPGAGASGSIWGMLTAMVAWLMLNRSYLPRELVSRWMSQLGSVLLLNVIISFLPGISAAGHFGGGAVGFVMAGLLNYQRFGRSAVLRMLAMAVVAFTPAGLVAARPYAERAYLQWLARTPKGMQRIEVREAIEMEEKILPQVQKLEREAQQRVDRKARELLDQNWKRRDPAAVQQAIADINDALVKLREAADIVLAAGPYLAPEIEKARLIRLEYVEAQIVYNEMALRCLRDGEKWTDADEQAFVEQSKKVWAARGRWRELLR